jgi:hypothetical protein
MRALMDKKISRRSFVVKSAGITVSGAILLNAADFARAENASIIQTKAEIVKPETLIAGKAYEIVIEVTNGSEPIPVGGAVMLTVHHAAGHEMKFQVNNPNSPGYVTVVGETADNFRLETDEWLTVKEKLFADMGSPSRSSNSLFHKGVLATVTKKPVEPHEKIRFTLGANGQKLTLPDSEISEHEFRVSTDVDGDRKFENIAVSPVIDILADNAAGFAAFVPADIQAGRDFEMLIRAEDSNLNTDFRFNAKADIFDEQDRLIKRGVRFEKGLAKTIISVAKPGHQRFRIRSGQLSGRSNPCMVSTDMPRYKIFWGDIHGHTDVSDGLRKTIDEYYEYGRDHAGLDVCAVTDHGYFDWPQTKNSAKKFYQPHKFVTILGQEGGTTDHINYYFKSFDEDHIQTWPSTLEGVIEQLNKQYDVKNRAVIAGPHHFTYNRGSDDYPFGIWDEKIFRFVEVCSAHGTSEYLGNPNPCPGACQEFKFMQAGLAKGRKFGVIGSSDTHSSQPGRNSWGDYRGGLVAFLAEELTFDSIWDAFYSYRVYAAALERIYIDFKINGSPMGTTVKSSPSNTAAYTVIGKTDKLGVTLIHNNKEIRTDSCDNGIVKIETELAAETGSNFAYLRVVEDNSQRAWSTPIWIDNS